MWPLYALDTDGFVIPSLEIGDLDGSKTDASEVEASKPPSPKAKKVEKIYLGPHGAPPSQYIKTDPLSCCRGGVVVLWGYSLEALELFREMVGLGLEPDEFTIVGLLVSCGQLGNARLGKSVHAWIEQRKSISSSNLILGNALLDMPDSVTMAILVHAAAEIGGLEQGKLIHSLVVRMLMKVDVFLGSALIDMYCKCGSIERAFMVFRGLTEKDVNRSSIRYGKRFSPY
ncbi:pentatricopeptide repeat-containing protein At3g04750, mitochondrial [Fagus crenata]